MKREAKASISKIKILCLSNILIIIERLIIDKIFNKEEDKNA